MSTSVVTTIRPNKGFSLIEMMVAMVVLSLSLGVLYQAVSGATRNVGVAGEYLEATMLAESLLNDFAIPLEADITQAGNFQSYTWRVSTLPAPVASNVSWPEGGGSGVAPAPLRQISVVVTWAGGSAGRQLELISVVPFIEVPQ